MALNEVLVMFRDNSIGVSACAWASEHVHGVHFEDAFARFRYLFLSVKSSCKSFGPKDEFHY